MDAAAGPQLELARVSGPLVAGSTRLRYAICGTMAHPRQPTAPRHIPHSLVGAAGPSSQPRALAVLMATDSTASSAAVGKSGAGAMPSRQACASSSRLPHRPAA